VYIIINSHVSTRTALKQWNTIRNPAGKQQAESKLVHRKAKTHSDALLPVQLDSQVQLAAADNTACLIGAICVCISQPKTASTADATQRQLK